jgi:hypothetical protein
MPMRAAKKHKGGKPGIVGNVLQSVRVGVVCVCVVEIAYCACVTY